VWVGCCVVVVILNKIILINKRGVWGENRGSPTRTAGFVFARVFVKILLFKWVFMGVVMSLIAITPRIAVIVYAIQILRACGAERPHPSEVNIRLSRVV